MHRQSVQGSHIIGGLGTEVKNRRDQRCGAYLFGEVLEVFSGGNAALLTAGLAEDVEGRHNNARHLRQELVLDLKKTQGN